MGENIRPTGLKEYIGQDEVKAKVQLYINVFKKTGKPLPHTLMYAGPGLGKTSLCRAVASDMNVPFIETFGPTLQKPEDIYKLLCNGGEKIKPNTIIFIDEVHSVGKEALEILYPIMEDGSLIVNAKKHTFPPMTILGGTTEPGKLPKPLFDRFVEKCTLKPYKVDDLVVIGKNTAIKYGINVKKALLEKLADISFGTPRLMNGFINGLRYFMLANDIKEAGLEILKDFLIFRGIDEQGFNENDRTYMKVLYDNVIEGERRPVGFNLICKKGKLVKNEVEELIEPKLLDKGYISFGGKGRFLTDEGLEYIRQRR